MNEKNVKKPKPVGIRVKLTVLICAFTALLLVVIWMLFVVFLDGFYMYTKANELEDTSDLIEKAVLSGDYEQTSFTLSSLTDSSILIFAYSDSTLNILSRNVLPGSVLSDETAVLSLLYRTEKDGGEGTYTLSGDDPYHMPIRGRSNVMLRSKLIELEDSTVCMMIGVTLTPVSATTDTIRTMLFAVSLVFIAIAVLMAYTLAKSISRPLVRINDSAKYVGTEKYEPASCDLSFREASELNETLSRASEELSKVETLRKELIANVSHDLRTPLTMIAGYGEVMRDIPGENTPENVQIIIDEAEHLKLLVEDMLSLSRLQSGMDSLELSEFCITDMIRQIALRYSAMKATEGYTVEIEAEEDVNVFADGVKISQVFSNLINNALNYTGADKRVTVKQSITEKGKRRFVRFDVIDTGDGILPENLPYIWDRYYKENRTHKRATVGTGLGLSIVKGVVEMHSGFYGAESEVGKGSDFWFELEVAESGQED